MKDEVRRISLGFQFTKNNGGFDLVKNIKFSFCTQMCLLSTY